MFKENFSSKSITAPIVIIIATLFFVGCSKKIAPVGGSTGLSNDRNPSASAKRPSEGVTSKAPSRRQGGENNRPSNDGVRDDQLAKRTPSEKGGSRNGAIQRESSGKQDSVDSTHPEKGSPLHGSQDRHDDASSRSQSRKDRGRGLSNGGPVFMENVYFDYDQAVVRSDAKAALEENSRWLALNSDVKIQIEGHGDERGTNNYNLALGERRARSIMRYLINLGISKSRFSFISYGEERGVCSEKNESCYQKNRRVHFFVKR